MTDIPENEIRAVRDTGQMTGLLFRFIGGNAGILFKGIAATCSIPLLISVMITAVMQRSGGMFSGGAMLESAPTAFALIIINLLCGLTMFMLCIAVTHSVVMLRAEGADEPLVLRDVLEMVREHFNRIFSTTLFAGMIVVAAYALILLVSYLALSGASGPSSFGGLFLGLSGIVTVVLAVAGIYLTVQFSAIYMARMQEELYFGEAVQRCRQLMRGKWWTSFGYLFVAALVLAVGTVLLSLGGLALQRLIISSHSSNGGVTLLIVSLAVVAAIQTIAQLTLSAFFYTAPALQYYNLVEQYEGTSALTMLDEIGKNADPEDEVD